SDKLVSSFTTVDPTCGQDNGSISANISGGVAPYNFDWTPVSGTTNQIGNLYAGIYNLKVEDVNGCEEFYQIALSDSGAKSINIDSVKEPNCGATNGAIYASLSNTLNQVYYFWNTGDSTLMLTNIASGKYALEVGDTLGCKSFASVTLKDKDPEVPVLCYVSVDTATNQPF